MMGVNGSAASYDEGRNGMSKWTNNEETDDAGSTLVGAAWARTTPDPVDRILAERRARQAVAARNAELSMAAWEHECAERASYEAEVRR